MKNTLICNDIICSLTNRFPVLMEGINVRTTHLVSLLQSNNYKHVIVRASKYAGRRPSWHIETGLLKRTQIAGFGSYVRQFPKLEGEAFDQQLNKAESLMTEQFNFTGNRKRLFAATGRVFEQCKFPNYKFEPTTVRYAAENQVNKRSSSGYPDFCRKGLVLETLISQAENVLNGKYQFVWNWPMTRGFRLQIRESLNQLQRKIRVMYPYPGVIVLLEDMFIIPFVEHFINTQTFYVIGKNGREIGTLLRNKFDRKGALMGTDISSFDQNMINEVIVCAFMILRQQMKLTPLQSVCFDNIVKYFCTSIMVSKAKGQQAYAFVKRKGVPSGSGFTNMIDTLCQAIIIEYIEPGLLENCLLCGDDNLFKLGKVDYETYKFIFQNTFNLPIDPVKSMSFKNWTNVYFLGFKWNFGIRYISPLLAINQCLWHTDFLTDLDAYDREVSRSASVLLNGFNGEHFFRKLFPEISLALDMGVDHKFTYLYGSAPPSTFEAVSGKLASQTHVATPHANESLSLHLSEGYLLR